jgi:hypothetical protein
MFNPAYAPAPSTLDAAHNELNPALNEFALMVQSLINHGFRFSVVHNPQEKYLVIQAITDADKLKFAHPSFNIYIGANGHKTVEQYFFY